MKANVVLDLNKNEDCESVAGIKMLSQLEKKSCHLLQQDHHHQPLLHLLHPNQLPLLQADHRPNLKPEHQLLLPPPDHQHPLYLHLHQDFLHNPSTNILMPVFSNQSGQKSPSPLLPFLTCQIQPSLMPTCMLSQMHSMMPTSYPQPTMKFVPSLKQTQVAEWSPVLTT